MSNTGKGQNWYIKRSYRMLKIGSFLEWSRVGNLYKKKQASLSDACLNIYGTKPWPGGLAIAVYYKLFR